MKSLASILLIFVISCSGPAEEQPPARVASRSMIFCAPGFDPASLNAAALPLFEGLGSLNFPITTNSVVTQRYFNQGFTLMYAFNHGEAGRSFKAAIAADSNCAMAYWGLAMILGPNYNAALNPTSLSEINAAIGKAKALSSAVTKREQLLIGALAQRFPSAEVTDMAPYHRAYAAAMEAMHTSYPDDVDIAALYADALMIEHPWDMWLKDGSSRPWTTAIVSLLETTLDSYPTHVGANHMYIHMMEASGTPAKAIASADRLRTMLPAAGHLVHMPSHIDIRTGNYHKGVITNENAAFADSNYVNQCRVEGIYSMMYYPHNIHFLAACAFLEGNSAKAIAAAWRISNNAAKEKSLAENITVQHYYTIPYYVLVQTGKWDEIKKIPAPPDKLLYPSGIWNYAQGMAEAAQKNIPAAESRLDKLREISSDTMLGKQLIWETNSATQLISIARNILQAEIAVSKNQLVTAEQLLEAAVNTEDKLLYQEPPDWFFSARHSLGHVLLLQKKWQDAEKVFLQDMKTYPENGWALMGLYKSLAGQHRQADASQAKLRFDKAWQWADLTINSSRIH